jgi:ADP-ribose pyrophosphatase
MPETLIKSTIVYTGKVINVRHDRVRLQNGGESARDVVDHNGAVAMVPMLPDGQIILVRQWRHAAGRALLEIPAGSLNKGENPLEAAHRELIEEIQYKAGKMERLFGFFTAPGFCTEYITAYLASELTPQAGVGDEDEFIETEIVTLAEALGKIKSGEIEDAKSISALMAVARMQGV